MPKYRLLTLEELTQLEKEFINYLILNGIEAQDWEKMKLENKEKTDQVIRLFSDVVFESIFRKTEYLEFREAKEIISFQCLADKLVLVGMKSAPGSDADFTKQAYIQQAVKNPSDAFTVYTTEKPYTKQRELELFEMTESGCYIADGKLFKALCLCLPT